ncbi:MAG: type 2 lanthipeptide synthetase LanM family protein [Bacteroidota bacterium]
MTNIGNQGSSYYLKVAERAATLPEKINEPWRFNFQEATGHLFEQRLAEWRNAVAPDDAEMFEIRLKNDGLSMDDFRNLLGNATFKSEEQLPGWIVSFKEMMEFLRHYDAADLHVQMSELFGDEQEKKIPFLHLMTPVVAYAVRNLEKAAGERKASLFSTEASRMMHLQLARMLGFYASQTFQLEFQVFISTRQSPVSRLFDQSLAGQEPENELYLQFVNRIYENGWQDFFAEYSSLAKIMTILAANWTRNSTDFIDRLADDFGEITSHFARGLPPGLLNKFKGGVSDSHNHGKGVISLQFESGLKLVYKPKNLELEQAWSEFLIWLNKKGLTPDLKPLDVIQRNGYGWVGFIEGAVCSSQQEVADYYRRIGSLIGVIYLLHGNDCHHENLIASGSQPILIDLESVMHHEGKAFTDEFTDSAQFLANEQFGYSVFRTGLLPSWITGKDGFVYDVSAIGGYDQGVSPYQRSNWEFINTDRMNLVFIPAILQDQENIPVLDGQKQTPVTYNQEIADGFTHFYHLAIKHRHELPIHLFAGKELRFIFRSTRIYGMIMKKMMNPKFMRTGIERSIQTELLCRAFLHSPAPNPYWAVFHSEQKQMEEADFPIFWADSDQKDIKDPSGIVCPDIMSTAAYGQVVSKLPELDEKDLEKQVKFIRAALFFRDIGHDYSKSTLEKQEGIPEGIQPASCETLLAAAIEIAGTLRSEAIFSKDGSCTWMSVAIIPGTERFRMQPMSMFLYDGLPGVALFLSALTTVSDDPGIKLLNRATIRSIRQGMVYTQKYGMLPQLGSIGITSGIPSIIYSFLKISTFLGDQSFMDDALRLSRMISAPMIAKEKSYDIISGCAGAILSLLSLHSVTGDAETLEKAILCGNHLLNNKVENPDGNCGWITMQGKMLAGFSHGQAGIAYALLKLAEVTQNDIYRATAERAIWYENSLFSDEHGNWQDIREFQVTTAGGPNFISSWCHGAPGIALARLASQHLLDNTAIQKNILDALETTKETPLTDRDHLCCGNLGIADILLYSAIQTGKQELSALALQRASQVVSRAAKNGRYSLFPNAGDDFFNPGFFQGVSGIGYELLRLAWPEKMPSVLIFE